MKTPKIPRNARRLTTYAELESYLRDFAAGKEPFLWIYGRPGLSKTESQRKAIAGKKVWTHKDGTLTPIRFFIAAYRNRGVPLFLDDADDFLAKPLGLRLVCALTDTGQAKEMNYDSSTPILTVENVPHRFYTNSPLCVIANRVTGHETLMSRATALIHFDPTNREIHASVGAWFWDQAIYDWFGQNLHHLRPLDVRWYTTAAKDRRNGRDWRNLVLNAHVISKAEAIVQVVESEGGTHAEKIAKFMDRLKSGSRATYARVRKRLADSGRLEIDIPPRVDLSKNRRPAKLSVEELDELTAGGSAPEEQPPQPKEDGDLDLPAGTSRETFTAPVTGAGATPTTPTTPTTRPGARLDDTVSWEPPPDEDEGDRKT